MLNYSRRRILLCAIVGGGGIHGPEEEERSELMMKVDSVKERERNLVRFPIRDRMKVKICFTQTDDYMAGNRTKSIN